ncbi:programmed cell death protein 4 [Exaiptasia diaphana]|uniref:Programmed cell death protein 4 n=1 Tax=Exaiptasia diaphana TaxID=2652724 RepID=A0A913XIZ9_EXADI|nr:programmed cell death protein 4 [Exaiptasia diaphana]KXJ11745.1 Programmed cell death protein 4 [Exaiptasia diaphana]
METVPTASTKKMRVRSKSTSDVGDSQKHDFAPNLTAVKGKTGLNGRAANHDGVVRREKQQHDRKSRTGLRGLPKKGGAGGKGTWGAIGEVLDEEDLKIKDHHDPNYESEEDEDDFQIQEVKPELTSEEFDLHVDPIIMEYFEHGDTEDVVYSLLELNIASQKQKVVALAVTHAFEKKASHRELASILISDLYGKVLNSNDIAKGFQSLLEDLDDLSLDTPDAPDYLAKFIARAVADDALAPAYVSNHHEGTTPDSLQRKCLEEARLLLKMKHGMCRLDRVWGVGGGRLPVKCLVKKMIMLLKEYLESEDVEEACRCVEELEVPHFHHELIYEAIYLVMDKESKRTLDLMKNLFKTFSSVNIVTPDQMRNGFQRVFDSMDDITLDIPHAYVTLEKFVNECAKEGVIPRALLLKIPTRGRKRFVSEGDGGMFKHT